MTTEKLQLYKCQVCTNFVEVILDGIGELHCCGKPMKLLEPHKEENAELGDKHIPILVTKEDGKKQVRIAKTLHPMINEHFIMFLEVISEDRNKVFLKYFYPNDIPVEDLECDCESKLAREYCNVHGLWEGEFD